MPERRLPNLNIVSTGTPCFPRYQICDQQNLLWTGSSFADAGCLYANHRSAAFDRQKILRSYFTGVSPKRFRIPLLVDVFDDKPPQMISVAQYLSDASSLHLNTDEYGNGPSSSLVLPWIEWSQIEQVKEASDDQ